MNFLDRMAARAIGAVSAAQPLVPARFSPARGLVRDEALAGLQAEDPTVETATGLIGEIAASGNVTLPRETGGDAAGFRPASHHSMSAQSADSRPLPQQLSAGTRPHGLILAGDMLPISEPRSLPSLPAPPHLRAPLPPRAADQPAATLIEPDQETLAVRRLVLHETARAAPLGQSGAEAPTGLQSRLTAAVSSGTAFHRRDANEAGGQAPIIRVSIGRIDVRAEFFANPAGGPARNPRPASLSLDEYLKQRREGKR